MAKLNACASTISTAKKQAIISLHGIVVYTQEVEDDDDHDHDILQALLKIIRTVHIKIVGKNESCIAHKPIISTAKKQAIISPHEAIVSSSGRHRRHERAELGRKTENDRSIDR